jgi:hypothetical protein
MDLISAGAQCRAKPADLSKINSARTILIFVLRKHVTRQSPAPTPIGTAPLEFRN